MQTNPKVTNIPINGSGGAFTLIRTTICASKVEVMEDPAYNNANFQGLAGYYMDPLSKQNPVVDESASAAQVWLPPAAGMAGQGYQPIAFGGDGGRVQAGLGGYVAADGAPILNIRAAGPNASGILLVEWP